VFSINKATLLHYVTTAFAVLIAVGVAMPVAVCAGEPLRVVVSIAPLHSLVSGLLDGIGEPDLLMGANASPHGASLKPSQMRLLNRAQLVIRLGEQGDVFLNRPLKTLADKVEVAEMMAVPGLVLLPNRAPGIVGKQARHGSEPREHHAGEMDSHIWLDPKNAVRMVEAIAQRLVELDAPHAARYRVNQAQLLKHLMRLDRALAERLQGVAHNPYVVFHDGYQYFERRYQLHAVAALSTDPAHPVSARRLMRVRAEMKQVGVRCVFGERQFSAAYVDLLAEGGDISVGFLDPLGVGIAPGKTLYFTLMQRLADAFVECLSQAD